MQVCPKCRLGVTKITEERSFWAMAPSAFVYPFRGNGAWILVLGVPVLLANDFLGFGLLLIFVKLMLLGLIGSVLIHVIWSTADDETSKLEWPDFGDRFEMLTVGLQMVGSVLLVFAPVIVCLVMMFRAGDPAWALAAEQWQPALARALTAELTQELDEIKRRQQRYLERELRRLDEYFDHYEQELRARLSRQHKPESKARFEQRVRAAALEHDRRRADQIARHEIRVVPHLDAVLLTAEVAWKTGMRGRHGETLPEAVYVPRARRWFV
jgi:hypothetical protein